MTSPHTPVGMLAIGEYVLMADARADLALLQSHFIAALILPDTANAHGPVTLFRLLVPEESGLAALQMLAREASVGEPRIEACPRCGRSGLRVSPGRRLLGLAELVLANQLAAVIPSCPHCGWSPSRDNSAPPGA